MKKILLFTFVLLSSFILTAQQDTVTTQPTLAPNNGSGGIAFNVKADNFGVNITEILNVFNATGSTPYLIWYSTDSINGAPNISTANNWVRHDSGNVVSINNTTQSSVILANSINIPAGETYGIFIEAATRYHTNTATDPDKFSDGTLTIFTGSNVGYGGGAPNPGFSIRQFTGSIIYKLATVGFDNAAVTSVDSPSVFCAGPQSIFATIANSGFNQIDSVDVNWEVNGVAQPTVSFIGLLDTINGTGPRDTSLNLGTVTLSAGANDIVVYTSNPNGVVDTSNFDDTLRVTLNTASAPTGVTTFNATLNSVQVNASGGAGTIEYEYGTSGFTLGTGSTGSSPTSLFTLTGLTQGTAYDVYVRSNCGGGDTSAWVGPTSFNTSYGIPFIQDFESFTAGITGDPWPEGWSSTTTVDPNWESEDATTGNNENSTGTGPLLDHTLFPNTGGTYIYMETSGGTTGDSADFVSPPIFIDTSLTTVELKYWYFNFGADIDRMEVIVDTNGVEEIIATYVGQQQTAQTDDWLEDAHLLTGYQGKSVTIKFRGFNAAGFTDDLAIDDVTIDPVLPLNAGVDEILEPGIGGALCAGTAPLKVVVTNKGLDTITSFSVVSNVNGVIDTTVFTQTILSKDTAQVNLPAASFNTGGNNIAAYTLSPNNATDGFTGDDTTKIIVSTANPPANFSAINQTLNSIDVIAENFADSIQFEYGISGFTQGTGTLVSSNSVPFTISGLMQGSSYEIYMRSICGSNDTSIWVGPFIFNTSYGVPYFQDFENFTTDNEQNPWPEGWSSTTTDDPNWISYNEATGTLFRSGGTGPLVDHTLGIDSGMFVFMETSGGTVGDSADFVSPPIYIDTNYTSVELGYWYFNFGANVDRMDVIADTNGTENIVATYFGQQQTAQTDAWLQETLFLNGYQGKSVVIKFRGFNPPCCSGDIAIDDVSIDTVPQLNALTEAIIEPSGSLCGGTVNPVVAIGNGGIDTITFVDVVSSVNGVLDTTRYNGSIATGDTVHVTLPGVTILSGTVYDLSFYTINPNGGTDGLNSDDTLSLNGLTTGLQGTITLDTSLAASATNYTSFTALANQLNLVGVCGNVTVNVAAGTYNDVFALSNVPGLSDSARLTVDGGDSASVTLENNLANNGAVVSFDGVSYVTVKNMTLRSLNTGTADHFGVHFTNASNYDSIVNCRILMNTTNSFGVFGIGASADITNDFAEGDNANYVTVMNCAINGASYSVHFEGPTTGNYNLGNSFINNTLTNMDDYGFYMDQQDSMRIIGNSITGMRSAFGDGIYCFDPMNFEINANLVIVEDWGIYISDANSDFFADREATLINNMVTSFGDYGIYLTDAARINIWHNSVYSEGAVAAVRLLNAIDSIDLRNNVFASATNEAFEMSGPADTTVFLRMDNNVYYTAGTGDLLDINTTYASLAAYQTARPGFNISSLEGNPEFVSDSNLHILGSFIDEAGDNGVNVLVDIDGDTRPGAFATFVDPGADEFSPPPCSAPTNISIYDVGVDSALVSYISSTSSGSVKEYSLALRDSTILSGDQDTTSLDSILLDNLSGNTAYDFYIREICRRGDTSAWSGPFSFETPCAPFTTSYFNDFESDDLDEAPDCWTEYVTVGNGFVEVEDFGGTAAPYAGSQALYLYSGFGFTQGSDTIKVTTPQFSDLSAGDKQIRFWGNSDDPTTQLIIGTSPSVLPNAGFSPIDTITFRVADTYQEEIIEFTTQNGYNGTDEYIVLRHDLTNTFDYIRIDDFTYEDIPTCPAADSLTAAVYASDSVGLSWNDNAGASQWQIEYDVQPLTLGSGIDTIVTSNPFELGGLTSNTVYEYRVRAICAAGDTSRWSSTTGVFETPCTTFPAPYRQDFENAGAIPSCMKQGINNAEDWIFALTGGHVGNVGTISGTTISNNYFAYVDDSFQHNQGTTLETPFVDVSGLANPTLEFYRLSDNEGNLNGNVDFTVDVWDGSAWNQVYFADTNSLSRAWEFISIPLSNLTITGDIQVRFVVDENNGNIFDDDVAIDDIYIGNRLPVDVGVAEVITPQSLSGNDSCNLGPVNALTVEVENFGTSFVDTLDVTFIFNGGTPITQTFVGLSLNLANTAQVTFDSTINLQTSGTYQLEVYTNFTGDGDASNDTARASIVNEGFGGTIVGGDSICVGDTSSLNVENSIGTLQWQELVSGVWTDITGADSLDIEISPSSTTDYRVLTCGTNASDSFRLEVINLSAPTTIGDTVIVSCSDSATATAVASSVNLNPKFIWYSSDTASNPIDTTTGIYSINSNGDSLTYFKDTTIVGNPSSDTVWVEEVVAAGSGNNTIKISELDPGNTDALEIQNVSGQSVDVTGWRVAVSDSYTDINAVNGTVQTLSGTMAPDQTMYWTDGAVNPWGSNLFWNQSGSPGWAIVIDNNGEIVDYMAFEWSATDILAQNITVGPFSGITPGGSDAWTGGGAVGNGTPAGSSIYRTGTQDNDDSTDWSFNTLNLGAANVGLSTPFSGGECVGPRAMAILTVDCVTGLDNTSVVEGSLSIYPNPSNGIFRLDISTKKMINYNLVLRNVNGKLVYSDDLVVNGNYQDQMDFSSLAKGVYYLQIKTAESMEVKKLIIQ